MPLKFEGLEKKFLDDILKLTREKHEAEDKENPRHRETFMDVQFPNGLFTYIAGEGLTSSFLLAFLVAYFKLKDDIQEKQSLVSLARICGAHTLRQWYSGPTNLFSLGLA